MEYLVMVSELMPNGKPNYLGVIKYPMLKDLVKQDGKKQWLAIITILVKDFCASMNVIRNMNEDQMIEAAAMLVDECDNFRLEDYVMMFQLAKRGELFQIRDRIDLQVITEILDAYWQKRHTAGESQIVNEINHIDTLGNTSRLNESVSLQDAKLLELSSVYSTTMGRMKDFFEPRIGDREERKRLKEIEIADTAAIQQKKKELGIND